MSTLVCFGTNKVVSSTYLKNVISGNYDHTLAQKQKVINWEKFDISEIAVNFFAKFIKLILRRIQATYFANFIAIFGCIQKL